MDCAASEQTIGGAPRAAFNSAATSSGATASTVASTPAATGSPPASAITTAAATTPNARCMTTPFMRLTRSSERTGEISAPKGKGTGARELTSARSDDRQGYGRGSGPGQGHGAGGGPPRTALTAHRPL